MDDGMSGEFTSLIGLSAESLLTTFTVSGGVIKGRRHRFKYRAQNTVGWGPYSDSEFVLAATVPARSDRPYFLTFANDKLSIVIPRTLDNGGTPISTYELWVDDGNDFKSEFHKLTNYDDNALIYEAAEDPDGLVRGKTYRFITRTVNQIGASEFSIYAYIAFGDVPDIPGSP